jgi:molybdopterin molybdotransferase
VAAGVDLDYALQELKKDLRPVGREEVALEECRGRVLAEDVVAERSLPPFDRAAVDGFALRAEDTAAASLETPVLLRVVEEIGPGGWPARSVGPRECSRVATGAPVPRGATAVVRQEDAVRAGEWIRVVVPCEPGANVDWAGSDVGLGARVLATGRPLGYREIALLAALGRRTVRVYREPVVAILCTGGELVAAGEALPPGKVYEANGPALAAAVGEAQGRPLMLGRVDDTVEAIAGAMARGATVADLVLTTGGVSVGEHDLVRAAYRLLGAREIFWRLNMRPGMPTAAARLDGKLLLGLSGNPAAALVAFEVLVRPLIHALGGRPDGERPRVRAVLEEELSKRARQRRFVRARVRWEGTWLVRPLGPDNPGFLSSLVRANALIDLPPGAGPLARGAEVEVLLLSGAEERIR